MLDEDLMVVDFDGSRMVKFKVLGELKRGVVELKNVTDFFLL